MRIQNNTSYSSTVSYTGRKIPRHLYHITNKKAYNSMQSDNFLKMGRDDFYGNGVFMFELGNFFKRWRESEDWGNVSLMKKLIKRVLIFNKTLVLLKIPTDKLNTDELVVRSQNEVLSIFHKKNRSEFNNMQDLISKNLAEGFDEAKASVFAAEKCYPDLMPYFKTGIPAKYSKLLKQKKQALEYIYPHHIPIDDVQKIGEVNLPDFRQSAEYDKSHPMKSIFKQLLKDTPESKALCLLN